MKSCATPNPDVSHRGKEIQKTPALEKMAETGVYSFEKEVKLCFSV